jgi:adenylate kinase family enzyme
MNNIVQNGKKIPPELIVKMLKKVVYNGNPKCSSFILSGFPEIIEDAKAFEGACAKIKALIYSTTQDKVVELKGNNLALFNLDTLYQKEFRLRTMDAWDHDLFEERMGNLLEYGIVIGRSLSGKTEICS